MTLKQIPNLIPLEEALDIFLNKVEVQKTEVIPLNEVAGRVLSKDIYANQNIPHFDRSPLDGFAIMGEDTFGATEEKPIWLEILEEVPAGKMPTKKLSSGYATKILTGAPVPEGTTAVIRFEDTFVEGNRVRISSYLKPGSNVVLAGEDIKKGELAVKSRRSITPGAAGMLASLGETKIEVFTKPKIYLLSTGGELINADEDLAPGKIRNSNIYALKLSTLEAGGIPKNAGIVGDKKEEYLDTLERIFDDADMIITTGGASVGDYDIIKEVFLDFGAEILFWRINIRPGTPVVGAIKNGKPIIGLSGNPGAASITYDLFVRPLIRHMSGYTNIYRPKVKGVLLTDFPKENKQRRFLRGNAFWEDGTWKVELTGKQNPGVLKSLVLSNCLVEVPVNTPPLSQGDEVLIILQDEWEAHN